MEWVIPGQHPRALSLRTTNEACATPKDYITFKSFFNFKTDDYRNEV
jgi:hypothetical protein